MNALARTLVLGALGLLGAGLFSQTLVAAEKVTLQYPGGQVRGEVLKITKTDVLIRQPGGKELSIPTSLLKATDIYICKKSVLDVKDAKAQFELGQFAHENSLRKEAQEHLGMAKSLDPVNFREKVDGLMNAAAVPAETAKPAAKTPEVKAPEVKAPEEKKPEDPKVAEGNGPGKKKEGPESGVPVPEKPEDELARQIRERVQMIRPSHVETKPKTEEEVKKWKEEMLKKCQEVVGGTWKQEDTAHFYMFSNVDAESHAWFKERNEELFKLLCMIMDHKDGDQLWNNKCPIYYFKTHNDFQQYAAGVDGAPGAAMSGGYFMHQGREVHICIPFYHQRGRKDQWRTAFNTLCHEGTHAFLQLAGNDVQLTRWLHEGMAQFIEFWLDDVYADNKWWNQNNTDRFSRIGVLRQLVAQDDLGTWANMRERPAGGMDIMGYALAWTKAEFFYRCFPDKRKLPAMIKGIKAGKEEDKAIEETFGKKVGELEEAWRQWVKAASKSNFKFH